jgi:hypothetical protein
LVAIKDIEFSTPSRKTLQAKTLEKTKKVTPSPQSRSNTLELFSFMFHAQDLVDVPALRQVGSTTSLSSEFSIEARSSDNYFSLKRMKFFKNTSAAK